MCLAAPAKVISISNNEAVVDYNGVRTTTRLDTLTEPLAPGDYVLIHTGFAIRRMSAADGEETLKLFDELADSLGENAIRSDDANSDQQADPSSLENASHSPVPDTAQQADPSSLENASHSPVPDTAQQADPSSLENASHSPVPDTAQQADPSSLENASHSPVPDTAQQADPSSHSPASHSAESPRGRTDEL